MRLPFIGQVVALLDQGLLLGGILLERLLLDWDIRVGFRLSLLERLLLDWDVLDWDVRLLRGRLL